jgi:hypothetical protein
MLTRENLSGMTVEARIDLQKRVDEMLLERRRAIAILTGRRGKVQGSALKVIRPDADRPGGVRDHLLFKLAVEGFQCAAGGVAMIGDDVEADVGGAMAAGLMGVLAQTGKYRLGQEAHLPDGPTLVAENLKAAVDLIERFAQRHACRKAQAYEATGLTAQLFANEESPAEEIET